jgi:hypothetical protein
MQTNNRSTPSIISMFWYCGTTRYLFIGWRVERRVEEGTERRKMGKKLQDSN